MGRKNKSYSKDIHQQAYDRLTGMQTFGESKKEAVANGTEKDKIFSFNTYKTYWKHIKYFIRYIRENHPECTTLKSAKKYVNEWLQSRVDQGLSLDDPDRGKGSRKAVRHTAGRRKLFHAAQEKPGGYQEEPRGSGAGSPFFRVE